MLNKFRGSLVGALLGDCLGSFYEGSLLPIPLKQVVDYTSNTVNNKPDGDVRYTDDSAMTRAMCRSILEKKCFDDRNMAYHFTEEYFKDMYRGYGAGVVTVFERLRAQKPDEDFTLPARKQFDGTGSYGNGAAMRIAPIALYSKDTAQLHEYACRSALITHSHINGVNGAILQAQAVYDALQLEAPNLDKDKFIDNLVNVTEKLEQKGTQKQSNSSGTHARTHAFSYSKKLKEMKNFLSKPADEITTKKAVEIFGNGIEAEEAVPAAIFAFLHRGSVSFEDSINYAISLGGDTDTIASMTGAMCGAYWGLGTIPQLWQKKCEAVNEAIEFADRIYELREDLV